MKLLPICINGRVDHMVDFESTPNSVDTFAISSDNSGVLLSLYRYLPHTVPNGPSQINENRIASGILYQTDTGVKKIYISSIEKENLDNRIALNIKLSDKKDDEINDFNISPLRYDKGGYKIFYEPFNNAVAIEVTFEYGTMKQSVIIYLAPSNQIRNAVIDCGSEATQGAVFRSGERHTVNRCIPLLKQLVNRLACEDSTSTGKVEDFSQYVQAESDGNNKFLYKSNFFAKKHVTDDEINDDKILPSPEAKEAESNDSVLRMCTTLQDLEEIKKSHIQLYNMKISAFGGVELPFIEWDDVDVAIDEIGNNFFYRKYILQFLNQILTSFCHQQHQRDDSPARILCLHVLVPNVYTPSMTNKFIGDIYADTKKIVENNHLYKEKVLGICVNAISESDASLIGAIETAGDGKFLDGTYLVLDAGKGTLDFSILKYSQGCYINVMKSGFVGASAAINYGFLLDLIKQYLVSNNCKAESKNIRRFIYENILGKTQLGTKLEGGDLSYLNKLMRVIDEYKIRYQDLESTEFSVENDKTNENVKLSSFIEWVEKCDKKVPATYVEAIMNTIINYVFQKISAYTECKIDYVIYAGRGFLYTPFKEKMNGMLQKQYEGIMEKKFVRDLVSVNNKNVCLFIDKAISAGRYNSRLLPLPYEIDNETAKAMEQLNYEEDKDGETVENGKVNNGLSRLRDKIKELLPNITPMGRTQNEDESSNNINPFVVGYPIETAPNYNIIINGIFYKLGNNIPKGNANVFYSKGRIFVRTKNNSVSILEEPNDLTCGLSSASLFPFYTVTQESDLYIPNIVNADKLDKDTVKKTDAGQKTTSAQMESKELSAKERLEELKKVN